MGMGGRVRKGLFYAEWGMTCGGGGLTPWSPLPVGEGRDGEVSYRGLVSGATYFRCHLAFWFS